MAVRRDIVHAKPALELKVASRALIHAAGGTDGSAATCGSYQQRMSDCQGANTDAFLRIDEAAALEDVTVGHPEYPALTKAMCRRQGGVFVKLPARPAATDWHRSMSAITKETSDIVGVLCSIVGGGDVSAAEIVQSNLRGEIAEAMARLAELDALAAQAERDDTG